MGRAIGLGCAAAVIGSFAATIIAALVLTLGRLFDDPFVSRGIVPFSLITMWFTIPGSYVVLALTRLFERRGMNGARLELVVLGTGAFVGASLLTLLTLLFYTMSGNATYLDVRVSLLGAFYGVITAGVLWGLGVASGAWGESRGSGSS